MTRLAVFDCDGTLVDSGATIYAALAEAFDRHGLALPPPQESRRVIGLSLNEAMAALLPEADAAMHSALAETYKQSFFTARQEGRVQEPLYDGILELLDTLEDDGWLLAVATGKSDRGLRHCLLSHDIHARFISLQTSDRHPSKPAPDMVIAAMSEAGATGATTIVVGDTSFDMGMALAAGAKAVGVGWGYHDAEELFAAGADAVAATPAEVADIAREIADG
ncbi:HAD-IA family hydrolase [Sphingomonas sabuli]|uniref:HAD-IA family hydrolase n=1 Tax=Sphingomonas sabuli TaxID=2764186 RepID=A0A7G9L0P5_9SPHN|nr:HAD-IA family hydrolase [Sphingomonas sabuli]QNM82194.1 HAD-IA family hydrolase [Sphingomonas sabuli]